MATCTGTIDGHLHMANLLCFARGGGDDEPSLSLTGSGELPCLSCTSASSGVLSNFGVGNLAKSGAVVMSCDRLATISEAIQKQSVL